MAEATWTASLKPFAVGVDAIRPRFESVLATVIGVEPDELDIDHDRDYPIPSFSDELMLYARLVSDDEWGDLARVQVFTVATADPTSDLLREINDYNQNLAFCRTLWVRGAPPVVSTLSSKRRYGG